MFFRDYNSHARYLTLSSSFLPLDHLYFKSVAILSMIYLNIYISFLFLFTVIAM